MGLRGDEIWAAAPSVGRQWGTNLRWGSYSLLFRFKSWNWIFSGRYCSSFLPFLSEVALAFADFDYIVE